MSDRAPQPNVIDCHTHWFPPTYYEFLARRSCEPRAEFVDGRWCYLNGARSARSSSDEWFDLESQFETAAGTGLDTALITSLGTHSDLGGLPTDEAIEVARMINEEWADAQRRHPGRFFAAAAVPFQDTGAAIDELEHAVLELGMCGVSLPSSIAGEPIDSPRLEPFYGALERLGVPAILHPSDDATLLQAMSGYDGRLFVSLGRVCDSSIAVMRLILSGILDRHPDLKILHFHAGGVLPYAAGRLDKNASIPGIQEQPTAYLKRMWVDTAMPHPPTIALAVQFYGEERVLYGSDNPCWNPAGALEATRAIGLEPDLMRGILFDNARPLLGLNFDAPAGRMPAQL